MKRLGVILGGLGTAVAMSLGGLAATGTFTSDPSPQSECFGHNGVEFGSLMAYLCEVKLADNPSGALYFTPSVDDGLNHLNPGGQMVWYKLHAAPNAFYVWENFSQPWGTNDPRPNGRVIALDEGPAGQCIIVWPSWTIPPTQCTPVTNGGTVGATRPLTPTETYSIQQFIANMTPAIPLSYR